jgi:hypothetical protein
LAQIGEQLNIRSLTENEGDMELKCSNLSRVVRDHDLGVELKVRAKAFDDNRWNFGRNSDRVVMRWVKENVRLKGDYSFRLSLTRTDIANLFVAAFKDVPPTECLEALRRAGFTIEELTQHIS